MFFTSIGVRVIWTDGDRGSLNTGLLLLCKSGEEGRRSKSFRSFLKRALIWPIAKKNLPKKLSQNTNCKFKSQLSRFSSLAFRKFFKKILLNFFKFFLLEMAEFPDIGKHCTAGTCKKLGILEL